MDCTTWGGKNKDILFVVSAYNKENLKGDLGGHLFRTKTSARGTFKYEFAG